MMSITYLVGDATDPSRETPVIIVHVCNDIGAWGKGFVMALSRRWPEPEREFRACVQYELGQVQFVTVEESLQVANIIGQHGIRRSGSKPPIRYEAIRQGLTRVAQEALARKAAVHMPRIGCGLAGGTWDKIEPILNEELIDRGVPVFVYDLPF